MVLRGNSSRSSGLPMNYFGWKIAAMLLILVAFLLSIFCMISYADDTLSHFNVSDDGSEELRLSDSDFQVELSEIERDSTFLEGLAYSPAPDSLPFGVGERLRYHMDFSFMRAGLSEMRIIAVDTTCGQPAFHFRSRVRSTRGVDIIYKVRDIVESWFDVDSLYSLRYERNIREGNYRSKKYFDFDHETGWVSISNEHGPKGVTPFQPFTHNIISALYWVRTQELIEGQDLTLPLHDIDVQYDVAIRVYGIEEVEVGAGTFRCWKIEPVVESEGLFKAAGRLWIWITDDERRLPVMMRSEIPVGSVVGRLEEYRLGEPFIPGIHVPDDRSDSEWEW